MEVHIGVSSFGMSGSVLVRTPYEGSSGPSGLTSLTMSSATAATAVPTGRRSDDNNGFIWFSVGTGSSGAGGSISLRLGNAHFSCAVGGSISLSGGSRVEVA
jgi:hypothetical protein